MYGKFRNVNVDGSNVVDAWRMSVNQSRSRLASAPTTANVNLADLAPLSASKAAKFNVPLSSSIPTSPSPNAHLCVPPSTYSFPLSKAALQANAVRTAMQSTALPSTDSSKVSAKPGRPAAVRAKRRERRAKRVASVANDDCADSPKSATIPGASSTTPDFYVISFPLASPPPPPPPPPPAVAANGHLVVPSTEYASGADADDPLVVADEEPRSYHTVHAMLKDIEKSKVVVDRALRVLKEEAAAIASRDIAMAPVTGVSSIGSQGSQDAQTTSAQAYEEARRGITLLSEVASALEKLPSTTALPAKRKAQESCEYADPQWTGERASKRRFPLVDRDLVNQVHP
ncbi:hypothetical protein SCHPADRAFT_935623 [Schizopora paradoxa]|uniref:Uncharacterized protein n=1 Tax=Schizopora paradoxa TaxID=27342 RepID=A0A0H2SPN2_9AGAM|nr:hypothetical protein SCHPADRAFT_935623 [Schizopora paradoxa]